MSCAHTAIFPILPQQPTTTTSEEHKCSLQAMPCKEHGAPPKRRKLLCHTLGTQARRARKARQRKAGVPGGPVRGPQESCDVLHPVLCMHGSRIAETANFRESRKTRTGQGSHPYDDWATAVHALVHLHARAVRQHLAQLQAFKGRRRAIGLPLQQHACTGRTTQRLGTGWLVKRHMVGLLTIQHTPNKWGAEGADSASILPTLFARMHAHAGV